MVGISVIICAHNPPPDYLGLTLEGLKAQTLPKAQWELLLIDNGSAKPLSSMADISWHSQARHVREDQLGLTHARLRGIRESSGGLLVFVDDDNVLASNYLAEAESIARDWPKLGAWGGQLEPRFELEGELPEWKRALWTGTISRDLWSNCYDRQATPAGAGLCIRRLVLERYAELTRTDPLRVKLGRVGTTLNSSEDIDMAFVACDLGLGTGRFVALKLAHLIPQSRVADEYLLRLVEGYGYSDAILESLRGGRPGLSRIDRLVEVYKNIRGHMPKQQRLLRAAAFRGRARAARELLLSNTGGQ